MVQQKKPIDILRERRGPVPPELRERVKQHRTIKKAISDALRESPKTVPELAETTGFPTHEVLWHLTSMRKYGQVTEGDQEGDYFRYALIRKGEK